MLTAALELFGTSGFDGVGARDIAKAANVPLGAIVYHFGTKAALYRAVLERVGSHLGEALAPAFEKVKAALEDSPRKAPAALAEFQHALLVVMAASPESKRWAKLMLREHMDPSEAFDLIYEDTARMATEAIAALIARASGRVATDKAVLIEAFARMGEVLVFRVVQEAVLRKLDWKRLGPNETAHINECFVALQQGGRRER
jgi:TetR/AcrR family transcriptional regulator, regulator of cefoperazone and chloramphenicol sensitivity